MVNHFWQSVDAILEDISVTETIVWCQNINSKTIIFHCSKNYSSPTRVTRLKLHQTWQTRSVSTKTYRIALKERYLLYKKGSWAVFGGTFKGSIGLIKKVLQRIFGIFGCSMRIHLSFLSIPYKERFWGGTKRFQVALFCFVLFVCLFSRVCCKSYTGCVEIKWSSLIDLLHISHNASWLEANIRVLRLSFRLSTRILHSEK